MADIAVAEVRLWGQQVGAVAETAEGEVVFEYADAFRRSGLEISPLHLPLSRSGPVTFPELRHSVTFSGLPGVIADALPDRFGNRVIRAWFAARGQPDRALSPVQRLLYTGERAIGALTFHPAHEFGETPHEQEALELAALAADARRIVEGKPEVAIPSIYRIGSSAGGMRPKAVVNWHPDTNIIRSGHVPPADGEIPCILKFDGVGDGSSANNLGVPLPFNRVEAAYATLAKRAGIDINPITLLETDGYAHLLIPRFDLQGGTRLHQHTLGGMLHIDYDDPGASSYEEYFRTILRLGLAQASIDQAFRRMVFNILAVNQDDHVKNLSFHMGPQGEWRLSPAYDITFASGRGYTARHQMRVNDKVEGITREDVLGIGYNFGVKRAERIVDKAAEALAVWEVEARELGVDAETVAVVTRTIDLRRRNWAGRRA